MAEPGLSPRVRGSPSPRVIDVEELLEGLSPRVRGSPSSSTLA